VYLLGIFDLNNKVYLKPCCEVKFNNELLVKSFGSLTLRSNPNNQINWEDILNQYETLKGVIEDFCKKRNLTLRPFPWDRAEVNMVGRGFSINLGFTTQSINNSKVNPIWVSWRRWFGEKVKEEVVKQELKDSYEIKEALDEAYKMKEDYEKADF